MRKQDQKVIQLEKEKLQLVNMIDEFHAELQNMNESEVCLIVIVILLLYYTPHRLLLAKTTTSKTLLFSKND